MNSIRVLIADDQSILVEGLSTLLSLEPDMTVVGVAYDGLEVLDALTTVTVDVVLMDIRMPRMNGVDCTKIIKEKYPLVKVLILTTFDDEAYIQAALKNGAAGYILKDLTAEKLASAIRNVYHGHMVMHQKVTETIIKGIKESKPLTHYPLVDLVGQPLLKREIDVLYLLAKGMRNNEIAKNLYLSEGTVKNYISVLYDKLGIKGRTKLMAYAIEKGVLTYKMDKEFE